MSDKTEITPEALAALALARHVREVAVESGADWDRDERIGPDTLHQWQEWYGLRPDVGDGTSSRSRGKPGVRRVRHRQEHRW